MALSLSLIAVMTPLEVCMPVDALGLEHIIFQPPPSLSSTSQVGVLQMDGNVPLDSINRVLELLFLMVRQVLAQTVCTETGSVHDRVRH